MQMLQARTAFERGMQLVAGMLHRRNWQDAVQSTRISKDPFQLVSWRSGARSRREDELARMHDRSCL